jgi:pyruvate/2-oxoglutarate dehydrogenase complex dihydrolipoamide acyltransferase (E2) component
MIACGICKQEFKDARGLQGHVRYVHQVPWKDYQQQFGVQPSIAQQQPQQQTQTQPQAPAIATTQTQTQSQQPQPQPQTIQNQTQNQTQNVQQQTIQQAPTPTKPATPSAKEIASELLKLIKGGEGVEIPPGATPMGEEVEVKGEKINYKVALNPEIFFLYSIFKAEAERKGNKWDGDFGDFLYMAAKDLLTVHGLRPAVVAVKEGTLMLKMPVEEE